MLFNMTEGGSHKGLKDLYTKERDYILYNYTEGNQCAGYLGIMKALRPSSSPIIVQQAPPPLSILLLAHASGIPFVRDKLVQLEFFFF